MLLDVASNRPESGRFSRSLVGRRAAGTSDVQVHVSPRCLDAAQLVKAGEDVRWLPRRSASTLLLPGNDFWMFDRETVAFTYFSGDGHVLGHEVTTDPAIVSRCTSAFEEAWKCAIPHNEYQPA